MVLFVTLWTPRLNVLYSKTLTSSKFKKLTDENVFKRFSPICNESADIAGGGGTEQPSTFSPGPSQAQGETPMRLQAYPPEVQPN